MQVKRAYFKTLCRGPRRTWSTRCCRRTCWCRRTPDWRCCTFCQRKYFLINDTKKWKMSHFYLFTGPGWSSVQEGRNPHRHFQGRRTVVDSSQFLRTNGFNSRSLHHRGKSEKFFLMRCVNSKPCNFLYLVDWKESSSQRRCWRRCQ